jgi:cytochrome P450
LTYRVHVDPEKCQGHNRRYGITPLLDREVNRHAAFGLGRHRCPGSNLARMELRVALEEWLARYPSFSLDDPATVVWSGGQIRGPRVAKVCPSGRYSDR